MDKEKINKFLAEVVLWVSDEAWYDQGDVFEVKIRSKEDIVHCVYALLGYGIRFELIPSGIDEDDTWISIKYTDMMWEAICG